MFLAQKTQHQKEVKSLKLIYKSNAEAIKMLTLI